MIINLTFDSSVTDTAGEEVPCPTAQFEACVEGVAKLYETQFTNPITIDIDVGWGEIDGQPVPDFNGAESISNYTTNPFTYAQIRSFFAARQATPDEAAAYASLGPTDPTDGGFFEMTTAEAKAFGVTYNAGPGPDGFVGIDEASPWFFGNTTNTAGGDVPAGDLDAFSFIAHEFSEIMGRQMDFSPTDIANFGDGYYPYDLFDYTAPGVRSFDSQTANRYFSEDGGETNTGAHYFYNDFNTGDPFDWVPNGTPGSFDPSGAADSYDYDGTIGLVSGTDLRLMDVLGYDPTTNFTWQNPVTASFAAAGDWTAGVTPGASDAAILDAPGTSAYTVTASTSQTVASIQTARTATLAIIGGTFTASGGTGGGANAGAITLSAGASLDLGGTFANSGSLQISAATAKLVVAAGGLTVSGTGAISLEGGVIEGATVSAKLTNAAGLIDGDGAIGDGQMSLVNQLGAVIEALGASSLTIDTGANVITNAGKIKAKGPGALIITGAVDNTGKLKAAGGSLTVDGAVTGAGAAVIKSGTLALASSFSQNVTFKGTTGELELAHSQAYTGAVSGFSTIGGTSLDLQDIAFVGVHEASFSGTASSGVLTVSDGTHTAHITLDGDYLGSAFVASSDGHGGTIVVDPSVSAGAQSFAAAMAGLGGAGPALSGRYARFDTPPALMAAGAHALV